MRNKKMPKKLSAQLSNNEFKMYIQFIVDSKTKKLVLSEALSRWETVEDGVILPGKYIGLMEKLCEYPVDIVKLDREVLLLTQSEMGKKLFSGVISFLHSLNLKVVCEGVETEEQNVLACESECDYIQGWYYTKALPEDRAEEFAREYARNF